MKMKFLLGCASVFFFVPMLAFASPVIRSGESVTLGQDQKVAGDFYAVGGSIALSGEVEGDAYLAGGVATLNAPIGADAAVIAGTVQVHAPIGDDLRVVAGEVTLADTINGDVMVFGGSLHILSTAKVEGDIIFFGGELTVEGPVTGSLYGTAENIRVDAAVRGNIEVTAQNELVLGDRASIDGYVTYTSGHDIVRAQNAVVVGAIQKETIALKEAASPEAFLVPLFSLLFAAFTVYLLARKRLPQLIQSTSKRYGFNGVLGLAVLGGVPFVVVILSISVLGLMVGMFLLAVYAALVLFSFVVGSMVLGVWITKLLLKKNEISAMAVAIGVVVFQILLLIPYLGFLIVLAIVSIVLGSIVFQLYRRFL